MKTTVSFTDGYGNEISASQIPHQNEYSEVHADIEDGRKIYELQHNAGRVIRIDYAYSQEELQTKLAANPNLEARLVRTVNGFMIEESHTYRNAVLMENWRDVFAAPELLLCHERIVFPATEPDYTKTEKFLHVAGERAYWFSYNAAGGCTQVHDADDPFAKIFPLEPRPGRPLFDWSQLSYFQFAYPFLPTGSESVIFSSWQNFLTRSSS